MSLVRSKGGRRSKLTPELQERITNIIARGHFPTVAAAACGIGESTYFRWLQLGEDHTEVVDGVRVLVPAASPYREFREAVEMARAKAQLLHMENIRDAAFETVPGPNGQLQVRSKNWTASAWFLERTQPQLYGRQIVEHQGKDGGPIQNETAHVIKVVRFGGRYLPDGRLQTPANLGEEE